MRRAPKRCVVRMNSEIYSDPSFNLRLSFGARSAYVSSLFYLATIGEPAGWYPYSEHVQEAGKGADVEAQQLVDFGVWEPLALGHLVHPYGGWRVHPEWRTPFSMTTRLDVYDRDGRRCVVCSTTGNLTIDHIKPWSLGGTDELSNLQTMCQPCNSRKGARI